ncbi:MAG TPA: type II secretion system protein [Chlamydiales bacterium]|jgi:hypothetical protein|nr:type II secretion system protein [Chlamydiales bacterium]
MQSNRRFTLLEIMLAIALLAIASGALFWRLHRMIERKRFDSDVNRFHSILVSTRSLAIHMKMDFRLELNQTLEGWNARLVCREDPDLVYPLPRFSSLKIAFNQTPVQSFSVDFYSSGFVGPQGLLILSKDPQTHAFKLPELFYQQAEVPLHPSDL